MQLDKLLIGRNQGRVIKVLVDQLETTGEGCPDQFRSGPRPDRIQRHP